jgi:basic amino acid/polyamine antiporter, APA family
VAPTPEDPRRIGLWSATALVVGHTIAVGIFLTPAQLIGALGAPSLTLGLWLSCGALVFAGALTFGELAARYPRAGGPYVYLREGWGERVAFLYGWQSLLVMDPGVTAALAAGLSQYLIVLWPAAAGSEPLLAVAAIWLLTLLNLAGLTLSARVLGALTILKLLALAAIVIAAFTAGHGSWSNFTPFFDRRAGGPPIVEALALGLIGAFFSFGGFWEASRIAEEVRDPTRTLPRALALGVACVTLAYIVTTVAFMYLVPAGSATTAAEFARRAGEAVLGTAGPPVFASIVVLSVVASAMALLLMAPRLYVAMHRDGLFPAALAALRPGTQTPARAMILLAFLSSLFVLAGTFEQILAFFLCTALGFIALAASALFVIRGRERKKEQERKKEEGGRKKDAQPARFRTAGYPVTPALFVLLILAVVGMVAIARPLQALAGVAVVLAGLPAHRLLMGRSGRSERSNVR